MGWSGGTFSRTNGTHTGTTVWQQDEAALTNIEADLHDTHDQDLADGINSCVAKDGSNEMTGPLDMGGQEIHNADNIGVNTSSPNIAGWGVSFTLNGSSSENAAYELALDGALIGYMSYSVSGASAIAVNLYAYANVPMIFGTNNTARGKIDANGNWIFGTAALATNATNGFTYVPTCAGTPTGTPTSVTGMSPIVIDSTNNRLYFYSGGAWRNAGP